MKDLVNLREIETAREIVQRQLYSHLNDMVHEARDTQRTSDPDWRITPADQQAWASVLYRYAYTDDGVVADLEDKLEDMFRESCREYNQSVADYEREVQAELLRFDRDLL